MLQRDVDVLDDLRGVADGRDELVGEALGLKVEHAHPAAVGAHLLSDGLQEPRQVVVAGQVMAPNAGVLADEDDLTHTAFEQMAHLGEDDVGLTREIAAANVRDGAEGAEPVAAIGNLHVGEGGLNRANDLGGLLGALLHAEHALEDRADLVFALAGDEGRHVGHLMLDLVAVAGGDAAGHDDGAGNAVLKLLRHEGERRLDALLHGAHEKRARVDDDDVGVVRVVDDLELGVGVDERPHAVAVDLVLGATQRDESDVFGGVGLHMLHGLPATLSDSW